MTSESKIRNAQPVVATWRQAFIEANIGRREILKCYHVRSAGARNSVREALAPRAIEFRDTHTLRALINAADAADTYRANGGDK